MTIDRHRRRRGLDIYWTGQVRNCTYPVFGLPCGEVGGRSADFLVCSNGKALEPGRAKGNDDLTAARKVENLKTTESGMSENA